MSITFYAPPRLPDDEGRRSAAVRASNLLEAIDHPRLESIAERARTMAGTACAAVVVVDGERSILLAGSGCRSGTYRRATSFCGHAILERNDLFCVPDAAEDRRFAGNPHVIDDRIVRFYAAAVIRDRQDQALGTLCVFDPHPRAPLTSGEAERLLAMADEILDWRHQPLAATMPSLRPQPPINRDDKSPIGCHMAKP